MERSLFDAISGIVTLHWYWAGPAGSGEKHARWRCYTPTQIVELLERAGLRSTGAYYGLSTTPFSAEGQDLRGRLAVLSRSSGGLETIFHGAGDVVIVRLGASRAQIVAGVVLTLSGGAALARIARSLEDYAYPIIWSGVLTLADCVCRKCHQVVLHR